MHGLGDNLMATPAIRELKKQNLEDNIYIAGFKYLPSEDVWKNNPNVTKYFELDIDFHPTYWAPEAFELEFAAIVKSTNKLIKEKKIQFDTVNVITLQTNKDLHRKKLQKKYKNNKN